MLSFLYITEWIFVIIFSERSQEKFTKKELCCAMYIKLQQLGAVTAEANFRTLNIDHIKKFSDSTPILLKKYETLKKNILKTDIKFSFEDVRPMILKRLANFLLSTISAKRFDIRHKAMSIKKLAGKINWMKCFN